MTSRYDYGYRSAGASAGGFGPAGLGDEPPREPGSRRRKLAALAGSVYRAGAAAASELKEQYGNTRIRGVEPWDAQRVTIPGSFPNVAIVTKGSEQMVLFPSYAKRHIKQFGRPRHPQPGMARSASQASMDDEDYWKQEWARMEDEKAVVDVDVRGWVTRSGTQSPLSVPSSPVLAAKTSSSQAGELTEAELAVANANMMARLGPFLTVPLVESPVTLFFYNDTQSQSRTVMTNDSGHFVTRVALDFVPTHVRVLAAEGSLSVTEPVKLIENTGVSLISDIDDTIKRSSISLGAREIFRNTFIRDLGDLTVEGVREWYNSLHDMGVSIHYCSNSPWQLFPVIASFFHLAGLPPGSIHLKQYSGMLQGIFEPVAERKKGTLERILRDFPERKFLLVGDSGEADLEVYTELAVANPGRILAVFIRDVTSPEPANFFEESQTSRPRLDPGNSCGDEPAARPPLPPRLASAPSKPEENLIDFSDEPEEMAPSESQELADMKDMAKLKTGVSALDLLARKPPPRPAKPAALRSTPSETGSGVVSASKSAKGDTPPVPNPRSRKPSGSQSFAPPHPLAQMQTLSDQNIPTTATLGDNPTPTSSSSNPGSSTTSSKQAPPPPLPRLKGTGASSLRNLSPRLGARRSTANSDIDFDPLPGPTTTTYQPSVSGTQSPPAVNKKVDLWRRRLARAHDTLDHIGVRLYTWRKGEDVVAEAQGIVREALREIGKGTGSPPIQSSTPKQNCPSVRLSRLSMLAYVDVVSTPTVDTPGACLRLHFDNRHYVFGNVSEGTQRIMASKRMSMAKVEDIFLSGPVDWHANGGLLGFLLTIADVHETIAGAIKDANKEKVAKGKKPDVVKVLDHVNIHGGKNLAHMLATARRFVFRKAFPLEPQEVRTDPRAEKAGSDEPDWADDNIRVWYVPVEGERGAASHTSAQASKSKKRKAEHMSESDGETAPAQPQNGAESGPASTSTPSQDDVDQQMRLGVARTVDALHEVKLGQTKRGTTTFTQDSNGDIQPYNGPDDADAKVLVRKDWRAGDVPHLPPTEPAHVSMCYIVKVHPGKGKFNVAKAVELGVAKQNYKLLVDGQTVTGKDGVTVTPEMVVSPAAEPSGFALVEVPDASYVDGLLTRPEWSNEKIMGGIAAVYWIVRTPEVLEDERVRSFMRENSAMKHIVLSRTEAGSPCLIQHAAVETTRLNMVDSDLFPSVAHANGDGSAPAQEDATLPYELGQAGAQLRLKPQVRPVNDNVVAPVKEEEVMEKFIADPEILRLASEARAKTSDPVFLAQMAEATADLPNRDTEVIPLGTGSALPSRSRNVSCTLIRVPGIGSYLLDCGENSLGQLRRMFGYEGADAVLRDLKAIWISHSHADHHLGTVSVLKRFSEVVPLSPSPDTQQRVAVIAHPLYHHFLSEYSQLEPIGLDTHVTQLSNNTPTEPPSPTNSFSRGLHRPLDDASVLSPFGLSRVAICKVDHCDDARAVALTLTSGLKLAYSGDCRPSRDFASDRVGAGAHLLVHEATLDDDLRADAVAKKHCTISEALRVGRDMGARNVLLTHFSQRYPRLPGVGGEVAGRDEGDGEAPPPVVFAFDFMRVRLGEFRRAREFLPALQRLYAEEGREEKVVKDG
ncbi:hypothetical protein BR93DRAFT_947971 [Coniochaeta sp. PMI_546]|nr:hypothetical protein BR93DRAFT_947971 [Coniochaeta sp. PMI_546]